MITTILHRPNDILRNLGIMIKTQTNNFIKPFNEETARLNDLEAQLLSHVEIFNHSALFSVSDLKGNILHANENFCRTSKYTLSQLLNKPHSIIRHPDTPASVFTEMWRTIGNGNIWEGEIKNRASDGSDYWVIATVAPIFGPNGKPVKYISVRYDITKQKQIETELLEAKKKIDYELLENINYAKYIHSAFLHSNSEREKIGLDSSLLYKAQKIVSGDFYKIERQGNKIMLIIGDSTGHGFSASYISLLALNALSRIRNKNIGNPSSLLRKMNAELTRMTHPNNGKQLIESADMIACCIDLNQMKLNYASGKMKAFIIRNGEIIIMENDKFTIGETLKSKFTNRTIDLQKNDCFYILSDGVCDQLGGARNRRFSFKKLLSLVQGIHQQPMDIQNKIVEEALNEWKGSNEQTDDITFFGVRI